MAVLLVESDQARRDSLHRKLAAQDLVVSAFATREEGLQVYLADPAGYPVVLAGPQGSGKTRHEFANAIYAAETVHESRVRDYSVGTPDGFLVEYAIEHHPR